MKQSYMLYFFFLTFTSLSLGAPHASLNAAPEGAEMTAQPDMFFFHPSILPIFDHQGIGRMMYQSNGELLPLTERMLLSLTEDMLQKAKVIACNPRYSPSSISISALGFVTLTWDRKTLCGGQE